MGGPLPNYSLLQLTLRRKLEVKSWIKDFEKTSAVKWHVSKTYLGCGSKATQNVYQVDLKCNQATTSRSQEMKRIISKNSCCPAKFSIVAKQTHIVPDELSQSASQCLQGFPAYVTLDFNHNHELPLLDSYQKDGSEKIVQKLMELYRAGYTPLTALEAIKRHLQTDYVFMAGDRSQYPDKQFCYRVFYSMFSPGNSTCTLANGMSADLFSKPSEKQIDKKMLIEHGKKLKNPLNKKMLIHADHNILSGERDPDECCSKPLTKNNLADHQSKPIDKPISSETLVSEIRESSEKIFVDCKTFPSESILVDIHNKPSGENLLVDIDEKLKDSCYSLQVQDREVEISNGKICVDLQQQLGTFCEKYNFQCSKVEKTEGGRVIVAVCSPVRHILGTEGDDWKANSVLPRDVSSLKLESKSTHFQSKAHKDSSSLEQCIEEMRTVFDDLLSKVECSPDIFVKPVATFLKNYHRVRRDNNLTSALHSFSNYSNLTMAILKTIKCLQVTDTSEVQQSSTLCTNKRKDSHPYVNNLESSPQQKCPKTE
ncbi:uncharacterized protein LOC121874713 isoform X2 [Homarus americanus]|uniref:uncharacterized protein LOC121874713 isoform X2 n=1 Tax=Homarus americanus TaxID=6706 RepID=UPI001C4739EE|nr:uncharacterized protein LOC121874713 isoform X2 [Homarus americanus]